MIRVSGPDAVDMVAKCWNGTPLPHAASHTAHLGRIIDPADGSVVDEVVLTLFLAPRSFTGENTVEISCHGSVWIQRKIMNVLVGCGCRAATAGEFTRRAFTNGRIDLSQAEAIADVIAATSQASHCIAMSQMRGAFSRQLAALRDQLLQFVSLMELELDFSEEDVEFADRSRLIELATSIETVIGNLADSFSTGNAIKNGLPVAIVGETNAGKSTLLNRLLSDDRALVSEIPGTTRDAIEGTITIDGILFRLIDTAGLRETSDTIENMGIERTFQKITQAQMILWIIDGTSPLPVTGTASGSILGAASEKSLIAVINKCDLMTCHQAENMRHTLAGALPPGTPVILISARESIGLDTLTKAITAAAQIPEADGNQVIVTNARHYQALQSARQALSRAIAGLSGGLSGDFVSQDIREAMHYLAEITGQITTDDILAQIFSRFCIGK